ncbi:hypothetical protein BK049_01750 [Bacillus xiamenensis]|uniref:Uncharacterized protein n=1 Tax=Bacillus xiamenensis TaxID=1178537 RepID=A0AAC9IDR9_9BACI|nr:MULTISPECIES: hypothetical protein [Bacillus]AOZ87525.1 hypothetical protein BK049_01750 [Bacillus xiamenensis]EKF33900.1 hypothetical protein BA1_17660 [Bacillus xiamenensis]MBG9912398.1 hypothetical protein [Bacillus xiamenensis]MCW1836373.1 hypothetical protein [Bacillus xiamenensis]MCY9574643.1 hypothetical protein [Bacillus xiamenensis]
MVQWLNSTCMLTLLRLFSFTIKEKEVDHMMNWSYDLIKIIHEEKLKELLLDETDQTNQVENSLYL